MRIQTVQAKLAANPARRALIVMLTAFCSFGAGCNIQPGAGMAGLTNLLQNPGQRPGTVPAAPANTGPSLLGIGSPSGLGGGVTPTGLLPPPIPGAVTQPGTTQPGTTANPGGIVLAIDPGHPSETSDGTKAADGTTEIRVAWQVAQRLQAKLQQAGYRVVLTKSSEMQMVTNRNRAEIGNNANAALCVRLHCDAASGTGYALYAPDRQGTTQGVTGPTPAVIQASTAAARAMLPEMQRALTLATGGVRGDSLTSVGARQGALTGSIFSKIPIVTVEMCVLTNARDAAFITSAQGQEQMATALANGMIAAVRR